MSYQCKKCGSDAACKSGFAFGKQRYLCKVCGMNFTGGDRREKHSYSGYWRPLHNESSSVIYKDQVRFHLS